MVDKKDKKVVSTEVVRCWEGVADASDEPDEAVIIVYEDGTVEVRCSSNCYRCKYGERIEG